MCKASSEGHNWNDRLTMETPWIVFSIYFLIITLLAFWLIFRFSRSQFREALFSFVLVIFTFIISIIIYNYLRDTAFGKWVRSGLRGEGNLMQISFLLAIYLVVLPCWLFVYIFLSFLKWKRKKHQRKKSKKKGNATTRRRE